jgi:hypothetical protein
MVINSTWALFIIVAVAALVGLRGWVREVVTMAIILGVVLFLSVGGNGLLHQFFFVNLPDAFRVLIFGDSAVSVGPTVSTPNPMGDQLFNVAAFGGLTGLAYLVGHKYGTPAKTMQHRLTGLVPGAVSGMALSYYVTNKLFPNNPASVVEIVSPTDTLTTLYLPIILGFALVGLLLIIVISAMSRRSAKG